MSQWLSRLKSRQKFLLPRQRRPLLQWFTMLLEKPMEVEGIPYEVWRRQFLHKRISLGLGLGALYFTIYTVLAAIQLHWAGVSFDVRTFVHLLTSLVMLGLLFLMQTPWGKRANALAFFGMYWSITILTNVHQTISGVVAPDLKGWTITFFGAATIVPFCWPWHLISHLGTYAYYFGVNGALGLQVFPAGVSSVNVLFDLIWISGLSNLVVYLYERLSYVEYETRQRLRLEQKRSERLLLNILPASVADRLMQDHHTIADSFAEVTVLFADIVGFTRLAMQLKPTEVVDLLNQVFSMFDELAERLGLEKIKTIGDAYMVVAGLPAPRPDHVDAIADMAIAMLYALQQYNQRSGHNLRIRIGIHTGPVVAGVIGLKKFAYDLWGDTVNTASRMESHGLPDEIQVTRLTYECLKHRYILEERGRIQIKGRGEMTTYLLKGKRELQGSAIPPLSSS